MKHQALRRLALAAIGFYQRFLSPYKGFRCAYGQHTGHASCSALGYRAVRRYGIFTGLGLIRRRTYLCGVAHRRYSHNAPTGFRFQRGFCDPGCDLGCDMPGADLIPDVSDATSCCDVGSCDSSSKNKRDQKEKYIYIPPKVSVGRDK